jgi:hypothetical protein
MFCGCVGHLDEFFFSHKRIQNRRFDYARNSYHGEFSDFLPCSYSRASPRTSSHALSHFSHGPNHRSYGFGSRENSFMPRCFGYSPRPHQGDCFHVCLVFLLEGLTLTLSPDTWTVHTFPVMVHIPLDQMVRS